MSFGHVIVPYPGHLVSRGQDLAYGEYFEKSWNGTNLTEAERLMKKKPEHPYTCSIVSNEIQLGDYTLQPGTQSFKWTPTSWPPINPAVDEWTDNDTLSLFSKLGDRARDSKFNGGNFLAEFHQVPKLISEIAYDVSFFADAIIHGEQHKLKKFLNKNSSLKGIYAEMLDRGHVASANKVNERRIKALKDFKSKYKDAASEKLASMFLAYDFGLSPLVSDAHDSMNALGQTINKLSYRTTVKARRVKQSHVVTSAPFFWNTRVFHLEELRGYLESPPDLLTLWHLNDPLSAAEEATPWSFAFDWVIPVHKYLSALDTLRSFHWKAVWKTTKIVNSKIFIGIESPPYVFSGGACRYKTTTIKRELVNMAGAGISALPTPSIRPAREVLSVKHALDSAALLIGQKTAFAKSLKF